MGSLWRSKDIPEHITKSLLDLFGSLKETVIWKYEDKLINAPKNVHVVPWAPQQSILCKLSINFINDVLRNSTNSKYNSGYPKSFESLGDSPVVQKRNLTISEIGLELQGQRSFSSSPKIKKNI